MTVLQAVLLGLLQGLTEFLPVSSSGHLVLARAMMGLGEVPVLFDVLLHMATLLVVIWVFRGRIASILSAVWHLVSGRRTEADLPALILTAKLLAASVITAVIGLGISAMGRPGGAWSGGTAAAGYSRDSCCQCPWQGDGHHRNS